MSMTTEISKMGGTSIVKKSAHAHEGSEGVDSLQTLKPLIYSFLGHVEEPSQLVLITPDEGIKDLPNNLSSRSHSPL